MFYVEEIELKDAADLLRRCGLKEPQCVDYTAGVFSVEEAGGLGKGRLAAVSYTHLDVYKRQVMKEAAFPTTFLMPRM